MYFGAISALFIHVCHKLDWKKTVRKLTFHTLDTREKSGCRPASDRIPKHQSCNFMQVHMHMFEQAKKKANSAVINNISVLF
jgi:hypothetical protein